MHACELRRTAIKRKRKKKRGFAKHHGVTPVSDKSRGPGVFALSRKGSSCVSPHGQRGEREMGVGGEAGRVKPYLSRAALKQSEILRRIGLNEPQGWGVFGGGGGGGAGGGPSPCLARAVAEQAGAPRGCV